MAKLKIPTTTDWLDPKEQAPPSNVWLTLYANPPAETGQGDISVVLNGYWSERSNTFIDDSGHCVLESVDVKYYNVVTHPKTALPMSIYFLEPTYSIDN